MNLAATAPLLCAGITTFSPLEHWRAEPGQRVGVIGLGGLGHMAVKLAAARRAVVTVFTTTPGKGADAQRLGAREAVLWTVNDTGALARFASHFDLLIATVPRAFPMQPFMRLLRIDGTLVNVGALEPLDGLNGMTLQRGNFAGSVIGGIAETQAVIDYCAARSITADVELIRPDQITQAFERVVKEGRPVPVRRRHRFVEGHRRTHMRLLTATATSLSILSSPSAHADEATRSATAAHPAESNDRSQSMTVTRNGTQPTSKGPDQYFTGSVRVHPLFQPKEPSRVSGAYVTFEPGARSAWHTHPLGQTLIVTAGTGWVQEWNGEKQEIRPGDVVWTPPGVKHWHGATATSAMMHIAIQEFLDGKNVEWMEKVSDEQYGKTAGAPGSKALPVVPRLGGVGSVSPALERYTQGPLLGDLWKRPGLSPRDRSIVTLAALIARGQTVEMPFYFNLALDNGVKRAELSEVITHLAFYSGWANAMAAAAIAKEVFGGRDIGTDLLAPASGPRLPLDEAAEAQRAARVAEDFGQVAPGVVQYTTDLLFRDLWLRPALAPRDRSLVTVSALVATGQSAQITFHLNRAMDNGLTRAEASETLTQLAFYAGWPHVFSALPVVKSVLEKRPGPPPAADRGSSMKLKLTVDGKIVTATLIDSGTTRDFVSLLPLTLTMNDLFKREKFGHLPRALSEDGERARTYEVGDVVYWPPGPDVAVFYRHDGQKIPAPGITVLGRIDSGVEALSAPGPLRVTLEPLE